MAVARHNKVANRMPIHIEGAVAPAAACPAKVSHRKAPGALSAIAFIVRPVKPTVDFISTEFCHKCSPKVFVIFHNRSEHLRSQSGHNRNRTLRYYSPEQPARPREERSRPASDSCQSSCASPIFFTELTSMAMLASITVTPGSGLVANKYMPGPTQQVRPARPPPRGHRASSDRKSTR